jgi:digeranylgeranylglycerophospholipid reductase
MESVSDVIVVGGGPCGSFTAFNLARHDVEVTVFEEHNEIGVPSHCAGHLSISGLRRLGLYPLPANIVENTFHGAVFHSPMGKEFRVRFSSPITCVVNRTLFDKLIAEMAEKTGAHYFLGSRVDSLIIKDGIAKGVVVTRNGKVDRFSAKMVVDAEGIASRLSHQAGLPSLNRSMLLNGVEAEVENVKDVEEDMVEVFFGKEYAPHFFAWLIPKHGGKAKVGLAAKTGNPKVLLQKFMLKHSVASKKLRSAKILCTTFHPITLGGPVRKTYSSGFLTVGDAASHVKPTTGGGVAWGLTCARIAAEVIREALRRDDFSSDFLRGYQERCEDAFGFDARVMLWFRKMFDRLSDTQVDDAVEFCGRIGLGKTLLGFGDIDFQGRSLLHVLPDPRMWMALVYFSFLGFSANP